MATSGVGCSTVYGGSDWDVACTGPWVAVGRSGPAAAAACLWVHACMHQSLAAEDVELFLTLQVAARATCAAGLCMARVGPAACVLRQELCLLPGDCVAQPCLCCTTLPVLRTYACHRQRLHAHV